MGGTIHPVYVCELTSPAFRGALAASGVVMITGGILAVYVLGTFLQWKIVAWVCLTVPLVMATLVFLIPEAPGWLVRKGLYGQADKALSWLRREEEEFATEVEIELKARIDKVSAEPEIEDSVCCVTLRKRVISIF